MALLAESFIILSVVMNHTIFFNIPPSAREAFICIDKDGLKNDTWPVKWNRLEEKYMPYHGWLYQYNLPEDFTPTSITYKLRFIFENGTYGDTSTWRTIILQLAVSTCTFYIVLSLLIIIKLYAFGSTAYNIILRRKMLNDNK